jgi:hypothetical protein
MTVRLLPACLVRLPAETTAAGRRDPFVLLSLLLSAVDHGLADS